MRILILDEENCGLAFAMRALDFGHQVRLWMPAEKTGERSPIGKSIVERPLEWEPHLKWADIILMTGNSQYRKDFQRIIEQGYPVVGSCDEAASWETDRAKGQKVFENAGIETNPYEIFTDFDKAASYVRKEKKGFAIKPWGGAADKALSFVAKTPEDVIFKLGRWKAEGLKGEFILQELIEGIEMGVSGWFGPGGWLSAIEEDWEEKRLMNEGLGPNTGEQGTIVRFTQQSKLFDEMLEPITEQLHECGFVGNVNVNCIIDDKGHPWPLEFTTRLGWPAFNIMLPLIEGDPVKWLQHLTLGRDSLKMRDDICIGVVLTHGDYPHNKRTLKQDSGFPIRGITNENVDSLFFQQVQVGLAPVNINGSVEEKETFVTAGNYVLVATGTGRTVHEAQRRAYDTTWNISLGGAEVMFRTDIGQRLKKELPVLQSFGYAQDMKWK